MWRGFDGTLAVEEKDEDLDDEAERQAAFEEEFAVPDGQLREHCDQPAVVWYDNPCNIFGLLGSLTC